MATDDVASLVTISQDPQPIIAQAGTVKAPVQTVSARPELQKYLILAKSSRGAASAKLVEEATAAPGVFVFAELLQTAGVKDLADRFPSHVALLELFSSGTWSDYQKSREQLPTLNEAQQLKLKQLTLVTLAMGSRRLPYAELRTTLDVASDRDLEDLIIGCIYADLLSGRLDQRNSRFDVDQVLCARDVAPKAIGELASQLGNWSHRLGTVIEQLDAVVKQTRNAAAHQAQHRATHAEYVQRAVADVQASSSKGGRGGNSTSYKAAHDDGMDVDNAPVDVDASPRKGKSAPRKRARA